MHWFWQVFHPVCFKDLQLTRGQAVPDLVEHSRVSGLPAFLGVEASSVVPAWSRRSRCSRADQARNEQLSADCLSPVDVLLEVAVPDSTGVFQDGGNKCFVTSLAVLCLDGRVNQLSVSSTGVTVNIMSACHCSGPIKHSSAGLYLNFFYVASSVCDCESWMTLAYSSIRWTIENRTRGDTTYG